MPLNNYDCHQQSSALPSVLVRVNPSGSPSIVAIEHLSAKNARAEVKQRSGSTQRIAPRLAYTAALVHVPTAGVISGYPALLGPKFCQQSRLHRMLGCSVSKLEAAEQRWNTVP